MSSTIGAPRAAGLELPAMPTGGREPNPLRAAPAGYGAAAPRLPASRSRAAALQLKLRVDTALPGVAGQSPGTRAGRLPTFDPGSPVTPSEAVLGRYADVGALPGPEHVERAGVKLLKYGNVFIEKDHQVYYEKARESLIEIGRSAYPSGMEAKYLAALEHERSPKTSIILYESEPTNGGMRSERVRREPALAKIFREADGHIDLRAGREVSPCCGCIGEGKDIQYVIFSPLNRANVAYNGSVTTPLTLLVHEMAHAARRYEERCGPPAALGEWSDVDEYFVINKFDNVRAALSGQGLRVSHDYLTDYEVTGFDEHAPRYDLFDADARSLFKKYFTKIDRIQSELTQAKRRAADHWSVKPLEARLAEHRQEFADKLSRTVECPPPDHGEKRPSGLSRLRFWSKAGAARLGSRHHP